MGTPGSEKSTRPAPSSGAATIAASLAAFGSMFAALSCCLPVFPFLMAAGLAGTSTFLSHARPYLLAASVLLIGFGFYQARRAKQCRRKTNPLASGLLWMSAVFVLISILFPQVLADAIAGPSGGRQTPSGQPPLRYLTGQTIAEIKNEFNAAKGEVRVVLFLSPT